MQAPATLPGLRRARVALERWLRATDVTDVEATEILVCVWEACVNTAEHPVGSLTGDVKIEGSVLDSRVVSVTVND